MLILKHLTKLLLILFIIGISSNLVRAQDADSDGVVNYLDIDDDNDGIKDIDENCSGFLAQNTSGAWKGKTVSNLTAILTGTSFQPNIHGFSDGQIRYYVNKLRADRRYSKQGDISFTYTFSTPVPANEIAFFIDDLDAGTVGSSAAEIVFKINGGTPNGNFILADYGATPYLTFDSILGKITPTGNIDDQRLIIKGVGNLLVNSITFTSTGIGTSDTIAYSLFANNPCDTDGDGIEDYLDLDSDGDGCPDAIEGGGTFTTANLETSTIPGGNSGVGYTGTSTSPVTQNLGNTVGNTATTMGVPSIAGIGQSVGQSEDVFKNDCLDTDGDGVVDWQDLDDDNDGILDAEESPNCFYTVFEANQVTSVTSNLIGDGTDSPSGIDIPLLYNDNMNDGTVTTAYNFASSQTITSGSTIFTVKYPTPIAIKSLSVAQAANGMASSGYAKLYGSNDNVNYTLLTVGNGISIASTTVTFNNTSTTEYQYYQIRFIGTSTTGNTTSVNAGTTAIHEIYSLAASTTPAYNPSAHPKSMICNIDTDGDTIPNNLDTDSDGDGCSDSYEGGATTNKTISIISGPYGVNGLANSLETSVESGVVNYISTYRKYATKLSQNLCLDTDNDGVPNPIDLDDDNDGVLDTTEGDFCGKLDRNIRVGYLNTGAGNIGLATNLLYNLNNFGINGVYNKVRGVTLIPFANSASVTEANLLAQNIDVFFVGSSANDAITSTDKIPTSVNNILTTWAKNNGKVIFALQNNATDYGYTITNNNINPNTPVGTLGRDYYTNGYWPTASLNQSGTVQMTIKSLSRTFDFLMLDNNLRPVVISDREYNLVIFPDATIYNNESATATPTTDDQKAIADTWSYVFDKFLETQCTSLDTDGDGIPNHLDLDSDQDGCSDAVEAGATKGLAINVTSNFAFVTNAGTSTDSNSDGLADIVDTNLNGIPDYLDTYNPQAINNTIKQCTDSDQDGYLDINDLDDDNDGILDTDEGQACNSLNRNLRIGYVNTTLGKNGLMINMLSNAANFSSAGTYNKFPGITFVPYASQAAITEAQLLTDNIDVFYVGSSALDAQTSSDKLLTATNNIILAWASNNNKGVIVLQNNATDYGFQITNNNVNNDISYASLGETVFTNGYWPVNVFTQSGTVQMTINSSTRNYDTAMVDATGKATFVRDRERKIVLIPDATIFIDNQSVSTIGTNATLKLAADVWAFAFNVFISGTCTEKDTDGDGIPNHLDLDSDNDGCSDAIEGGGNFNNSSLVNSAMSGGNSGATSGTYNLPVIQNLGNTVGSTITTLGIPTIAGTGQSFGYSDNADVKMCTDNDADGVSDVCDLDDDNDGILDVNENNCTDTGIARSVRIGYIPNSRDLDADNGYTFDGGYMNGSGALKLTNSANFGPTGIVKANITLVPITANPITKADITALNLNAIFLGGIDNTVSSYLSDPELVAIKDWSDDKDSNFVVVTQFQSKSWSSTITSGNVNPDKPTDFGIGTSIFNGPFGAITSFNQGGGYQAYFATLNGACSTKKLAVDNNNRTVMYLDGIYNDLVIADVDILTTLGGITSGSAITSNNDKLFANIWAYVASQSSCSDIDTDGDGIPNRLDLDSDGDGCTDAIEGVGSFTNSQLTTASGISSSQSPNQNFGVTVDANGIPTIVGATGQVIGESQDFTKNDCIDTDGDGVPNWQDLDDDNDGILDTTECPMTIKYPVFHLYDNDNSSNTNFLDLYKESDGISSPYVCPTNDCSTNPYGALYKTTNITDTVTNLAFGNGKFYLIDVNGNLLFTNNIISGNFTNLGNANIGTGFKNLGYDNDVFYHWKYDGTRLTLYSSTDPVNLNWTLLGTIINCPYSYLIGGYTYELKDIAVNNGAFYFYYYNTIYVSDNALRTRVLSSTNPLSSSAVWTDLGTTNFGGNVYNLAYGSETILTTCDTDGDGIPNYLDLDSDNDGCLDALEGGANITSSQLVNAGGTITLGTGSTASNQNLCASSTCVDINGIPFFNTLPTGYTNGAGQSIGDSQNAAIKSGCFCYKSAQTTGATLDTNHGITALGRAGADNSNWPMVRKGAWTVLEAKTKGFVVNRLTDAQVAAIPSADLREGMMVYNITQDCLQINVDGTATGWKCFNTQTCPD